MHRVKAAGVIIGTIFLPGGFLIPIVILIRRALRRQPSTLP